MQMTKKNGQRGDQSNYTDEFFERGHWGLKSKQILIALLGWIGVVIPVTFVSIAFTKQHLKIFGIDLRLDDVVSFGIFLMIILVFSFVIIGGFSISMAIIQQERSKHYLNNWPNFDPIKREVIINRMEAFATEKYGEQEYRYKVRTLVIPEELNIENGKLLDLVKEIDNEDKED